MRQNFQFFGINRFGIIHVLKPLRFWLRIRREIRNQKSNPRIDSSWESARLPWVTLFQTFNLNLFGTVQHTSGIFLPNCYLKETWQWDDFLSKGITLVTCWQGSLPTWQTPSRRPSGRGAAAPPYPSPSSYSRRKTTSTPGSAGMPLRGSAGRPIKRSAGMPLLQILQVCWLQDLPVRPVTGSEGMPLTESAGMSLKGTTGVAITRSASI